MSKETNTWLKFASMNRKAGRQSQAKRTLVRLLEYDLSEFSAVKKASALDPVDLWLGVCVLQTLMGR